MNSDIMSQEPGNRYVQYLPGTKQKEGICYAKPYVKCLAILISNCYSSTIEDERNYGFDDTEEILKFFQKYSDDRYRCFQTTLYDQ